MALSSLAWAGAGEHTIALAEYLARKRIYYGWYIVAVAFMVQMISSGYHVYAPSVLLKPMVTELGWNRAMFASIISLAGLVTGFLSPLIGSLLDRRGARDLMVGGALIVGLGFIGLGRIDAYWQFVLLQGLFIPVGFLGIGVLAGSVAVSNWFIRKRGRALSLSMSGLAAGNFVVTPVTALLVTSLGWRNGVLILGLLAWGLVVLPTALMMRRRPEDVGLHPDGEPSLSPDETTAQPQLARQEKTWTRRQAVRTSTLWLLIGALTLYSLGTGGLLLHLVSYFTDAGLTGRTAAGIMMAIGITSLGFRLFFGFLLDRVSVLYLAVAGFVLSALAVGVLLAGGGQLALALVSLTILGLSLGINLPAQEAIWANYYGRRSLGTVRSLAMPFTQVGSAAGASFSGLVYTLASSYVPAFVTIIMVLLIAAGLLALARPPHPPTQESLALKEG